MRRPLLRRDRRGSNLIEFALILPVYVFLMVAIMDFSWFFYIRSTVVNAVRDGCRAGAVISPADNPGAVAEAAMRDFLATWGSDCNNAGTNCVFTISSSGLSPEERLNCAISVDFTPLVGIVPTPESTVASATVHFELQR